MNTSITTLDDRLLAAIVGGTDGQTTGFDPLPIFGPGPVLPDQNGLEHQDMLGGDLRHLIGPCPNPHG